MIEEGLLRFAAPELYKKMVEIFSIHHIHPYDVQALVLKNKSGLDITLRLSSDFSKSVSKQVSCQQVENPDEEVTRFFEEAAERCKSVLIAAYYKMIKL